MDNAPGRGRVASMTSPDFDAERSRAQPAVQTLLVDKRNDQVGLVMGHAGPYVQLRPPQGVGRPTR